MMIPANLIKSQVSLACESYFMLSYIMSTYRLYNIGKNQSWKKYFSLQLWDQYQFPVDHDRLQWSLKMNIPWHQPAMSVIIIQYDPSKSNATIFVSVSLTKSIKQLLCQISKRWWVTFHRKKFTLDSPTRFLRVTNSSLLKYSYIILIIVI